MRLLDVDGEYGCIASWVTPEISEGGRKVVLHMNSWVKRGN